MVEELIKELAPYGISYDEAVQIYEGLSNEEDDITTDTDVRVIKQKSIDDILAEELQQDKYVLGCFKAEFICDIAKIPREAVDALQEAGAYAALGKWIAKAVDMKEFAKAYARADSYGHHFNRYNFSQSEITLAGEEYLLFLNRS